MNGILASIDLWLVPSSNPDGNELQQRWNGIGKDLNRDHLILMQPETRALHDVYDRILPEATLDVHEFQPVGKAWEDVGYYRVIDEQWGAPTNPNVDVWLRRYGVETMFPALRAGLEADGFRFYNYTIISTPADTMRHSTTNVNDGRQSLASQGSYSFILEGRNGRTFHDEIERRTKGQLSALTHYLTFIGQNAGTIRAKVQAARATIPVSRDSVVLLAEYLFTGEAMPMPVRTIAGGANVEVGEMRLKAGHAGDGALRRANLGRKVRQGGEVVAQLGGVGGEPVTGQLHAVAGVAGESDQDPVDLAKLAHAGCSLPRSFSYTHLRAHATVLDLVFRLLLDTNKPL